MLNTYATWLFCGDHVSAVLAPAGFQNYVHLGPQKTFEAEQELLDMVIPPGGAKAQ